MGIFISFPPPHPSTNTNYKGLHWWSKHPLHQQIPLLSGSFLDLLKGNSSLQEPNFKSLVTPANPWTSALEHDIYNVSSVTWSPNKLPFFRDHTISYWLSIGGLLSNRQRTRKTEDILWPNWAVIRVSGCIRGNQIKDNTHLFLHHEEKYTWLLPRRAIT